MRNDYDARYFISTAQGSVSNINFSYSADNIYYDDLSDYQMQNATFNFKLPSGITTDQHKYIELLYDDDSRSDVWFTIPANSQSVQTTQYIRKGEKFRIIIEEDDTTYYYNSSSGFTADETQATEFSQASSYTVDLSEYYSVVTGSVSRNGAHGGEFFRFSINADISTGNDQYRQINDYISFGKNVDSTDYCILIPKAYSENEMELYINYSSATRETTSIKMPVQSIVQNFTFPDNCTKKISGTITLSEPAPAGGVALEFNNSWTHYLIAEGASSTKYEMYIPSERNSINVITISTNTYFDALYESSDLSEDTADIDIPIPKYTGAKAVSGAIRIAEPSKMTNAVSYRFHVDSNTFSSDIYGTIPKGASSVPYTVILPDDARNVSVSLEEIYSGDMEYMQPSDYYDIEIPSSGKLNNINFVLSETTNISLYASNLKNLPNVNLDATIIADNGTRKNIEFDTDGKANVELDSADAEGAQYFTVLLNASGTDGEKLYDYELYLNPDGSFAATEDEAYKYPISSVEIEFNLYDNSILIDDDSFYVNSIQYNDESGEITISYDKSIDATLNAAAVIAVYNIDGTLAASGIKTLSLSSDSSITFNPKLDSMVMPEGGKVKVMIWNNLYKLTPVPGESSSTIIEEIPSGKTPTDEPGDEPSDEPSDEPTIEIPQGKRVTLKASDFDRISGRYIYFFESSGLSTKYELSDDVKYYIDGVVAAEDGATSLMDSYYELIESNPAAKDADVYLIKTDSTSPSYDVVYIVTK